MLPQPFHELDHNETMVEANQGDFEAEHGDANSSPYRSVKRRRRLTQEETKTLNSVFEATTKPNSQARKKLAEKLGMTPRAVQIWFQNRRAKQKRDTSDADGLDAQAYLKMGIRLGIPRGPCPGPVAHLQGAMPNDLIPIGPLSTRPPHPYPHLRRNSDFYTPSSSFSAVPAGPVLPYSDNGAAGDLNISEALMTAYRGSSSMPELANAAAFIGMKVANTSNNGINGNGQDLYSLSEQMASLQAQVLQNSATLPLQTPDGMMSAMQGESDIFNPSFCDMLSGEMSLEEQFNIFASINMAANDTILFGDMQSPSIIQHPLKTFTNLANVTQEPLIIPQVRETSQNVTTREREGTRDKRAPSESETLAHAIQNLSTATPPNALALETTPASKVPPLPNHNAMDTTTSISMSRTPTLTPDMISQIPPALMTSEGPWSEDEDAVSASNSDVEHADLVAINNAAFLNELKRTDSTDELGELLRFM
ncbi:hypothetical protein BZG36_02333 [Bifiguratus adelaidae]|uniref:Homeobox domain-containing protein n=1 Tax=Bifiguratus adelaidae TaxID=1938954 RepID=A0A261Y2M2_9FUNG|nr:hypothetical protein BZG36_02333 [Bifiguratus adelaidae]